jgi:hypothetical protein
MNSQKPVPHDDFETAPNLAGDSSEIAEEDLWFLPGPPEDEPDVLPPGPRGDPEEASVLDEWASAEAECAARLARVAGLLGALDDRLLRGPTGWKQRLALIECGDLSWFVGDRITPDRLALWVSMRSSGAQADASALTRIGWAVRRLSGDPGPEADLPAFLNRRAPPGQGGQGDTLHDRAQGWEELMRAARFLHPLTRACMGFHLWQLAGLGQHGDRMEAAVTASRVAASECRGAVFAPLIMGAARGLVAGGPPKARLSRWLDGMETATRCAMRHLTDIEAWSDRAERIMTPLSGRTPPALRRVLGEWPLVSAPMAEALTGASRAAVQRNLAWMEKNGLIREVTRQGRFRMWRAD